MFARNSERLYKVSLSFLRVTLVLGKNRAAFIMFVRKQDHLLPCILVIHKSHPYYGRPSNMRGGVIQGKVERALSKSLRFCSIGN